MWGSRPVRRDRLGATDRRAIETPHCHRRDWRHHCRRGRVHDGRGIQVRRRRRRRAHRRRAADEEVRGCARRPGVLGRQPGHERRALDQARQRGQSAGGPVRCRRCGDHARHRHDGGDGVLPQSRREDRQAGRPHRLDAAVDVAQRGRTAEHLQRRRRRVGPESEGAWRAGRRERRHPRRARDHQAPHHRRRDLRLA